MVICGPGCLGLNLLVSQAAQILNTNTYFFGVVASASLEML